LHRDVADWFFLKEKTTLDERWFLPLTKKTMKHLLNLKMLLSINRQLAIPVTGYDSKGLFNPNKCLGIVLSICSSLFNSEQHLSFRGLLFNLSFGPLSYRIK